jgi:uncharacterized protein (DUF433 family)
MGACRCIRGLRIPVATVVAMVADGMSTQQILAAYRVVVFEHDRIRRALPISE